MPALHSATPLLLDASCVISLYASSQMEPILGVYPAQIGVVDVVRTGEMLDVWDGPDENVRQHTNRPRSRRRPLSAAQHHPTTSLVGIS